MPYNSGILFTTDDSQNYFSIIDACQLCIYKIMCEAIYVATHWQSAVASKVANLGM